jgi:multiple sugar transport system permease protein
MQTELKETPRPVRSPGWLSGFTDNTLQGMARRKALMGFLFVAPTMLGLLIFIIGPILASFVLSLYEWDIITDAVFVGPKNYTRMVGDAVILTSFRNTFVFVLMAVTLQIVLSLALALAIQQKRMPTWGRYFFRSIFFLPLLTSGATISIVLAYMFQKEFGPINYYLGFLGIPRVSWLNSSQWSLITVMLTYVWHQLGFTLIVFIGGLGNISKELLDAADVDGATGWPRLRYIIIPLLSPTLFFAAVVGIINALQIFSEPYVMTKGGPGDSSRTVVMNIYESAFQNLQVGYGSAISVILFLLIMLVTAAQFYLSKRWVFYQ